MILLNKETKEKEKANNKKNVNKLLGGRQKFLIRLKVKYFYQENQPKAHVLKY